MYSKVAMVDYKIIKDTGFVQPYTYIYAISENLLEFNI
jgi:hypothetical protein